MNSAFSDSREDYEPGQSEYSNNPERGRSMETVPAPEYCPLFGRKSSRQLLLSLYGIWEWGRFGEQLLYFLNIARF